MTETSVVDNGGDLPICQPDADQTIYKALSQAPYIIASLGHLLLNAAERDFSLSEHQKFDFLKYNNSFRACAAQVSQGVWQSFHTAHCSMYQIHMKSENIANNVKKASEVIEKGTKEEWPIAQTYLKSTEKWCIECVETAASITKALETVASMMDELSIACIQSNKEYKDEKQKTNLKVDALRIEQEQRKHREEQLKEKCEQEKRELEENKKRYATAVDSFPSPWKIALFQCFDGVANVGQDLLIQISPQLLMPWYIPTLLPATNQTAQTSSTLAMQTSASRPTSSLANENGSIQSQTTGITEMIVDNANKKQEERRELLLKSYESYERCHDEIFEENKKMDEVIRQLAKFTHTGLDQDQIYNALRESMTILRAVIQYWQKLHDTFQDFSNAIKNRLEVAVQNADGTTITANELIRSGQKTSEITLQMLIRDCKEAQQIAVVVKSISSLYVKVSQTYLLEALNRLQRIDPLEPSTDREKMDEIRKELKDNLERARDGISKIAKENKEKLSESVRNLEKILSEDQLEAWYK